MQFGLANPGSEKDNQYSDRNPIPLQSAHLPERTAMGTGIYTQGQAANDGKPQAGQFPGGRRATSCP